jgi:signal transduction histidine kinase
VLGRYHSPTYFGPRLDLAISRRLADLLGGRLDVDSRPGQGSTFRLVLPRAVRA